ncbi:TRAP transporter small permease [Amorphus coralli]|uniref:TRAP transporter small permease n=1 Tax=Amorphus coralli TaxID=340680 RepID=UPI0003714A07|nr:TRAP transporter small permease subunit [Amorphus coralli]
MRLAPARLVGRLTYWLALAGVGTLIVAIVLTCADIVWRRAVGGAFIDTFDITKLCLVSAASLSIPYGFTLGSHITVDILADRFSDGVRRVLDTVISLVAAMLLGFLFWLTWQGAMLRYSYGDTTLNLQIPLIWYWGIFLAGLALAVVAALARAAETAVYGPMEKSA